MIACDYLNYQPGVVVTSYGGIPPSKTDDHDTATTAAEWYEINTDASTSVEIGNIDDKEEKV